MAYVRTKGNQLALVHGVRDKEAGKVLQETLFVIYSKAEALAILGRGEVGGGRLFERLMERANPELRFNWPRIRKQVEDQMHALPDLWEYRDNRLRDGLRTSLRQFAKALMQASPQHNISSARLLAEHRHELEFVRALIDWRLRTCLQEEDEWNRDNPFYWFHALPSDEVDPDEEEAATNLIGEGRLDEAEARFRLFVECFPRYADGYNHLGGIQEERGDMDGAIQHFERAIEVGRTLFPKRMAKRRYWSDLSTRPYMRGLRNMTNALNLMGRYQEALELCDRMDAECGDDITAGWYRGEVFLNMGRWSDALRWLSFTTGLWPSRDVLAAFAAYELGDHEDAAVRYIHGFLNGPRAARIIVGLSPGAIVDGFRDAQDHNSGVDWLRTLDAYLRRRSSTTLKFFSRLAQHSRARSLEKRLQELNELHRNPETPNPREVLEEMNHLKSMETARYQARRIMDTLVD